MTDLPISIDFTQRDYEKTEEHRVELNVVPPMSWDPRTSSLNIAPASSSSSGILTNQSQTIGGLKTFNVSPHVPLPTSNDDAVSKRYVDDSIIRTHWIQSINKFWNFSTGEPTGLIDKGRYVSTLTHSGFTKDYIWTYNLATTTFSGEQPIEGYSARVVDDDSPIFANQCVTYNGSSWVSFATGVDHQSLIGAGALTHAQIDSTLDGLMSISDASFKSIAASHDGHTTTVSSSSVGGALTTNKPRLTLSNTGNSMVLDSTDGLHTASVSGNLSVTDTTPSSTMSKFSVIAPSNKSFDIKVETNDVRIEPEPTKTFNNVYLANGHRELRMAFNVLQTNANTLLLPTSGDPFKVHQPNGDQAFLVDTNGVSTASSLVCPSITGRYANNQSAFLLSRFSESGFAGSQLVLTADAIPSRNVTLDIQHGPEAEQKYASLTSNGDRLILASNAAQMDLEPNKILMRNQLQVTDETESTTTSTGSVVTAGGIGVVKNAHIGGSLTLGGNASVGNMTVAGSLTAVGGLTAILGATVNASLSVGETSTANAHHSRWTKITSGASHSIVSTGPQKVYIDVEGAFDLYLPVPTASMEGCSYEVLCSNNVGVIRMNVRNSSMSNRLQVASVNVDLYANQRVIVELIDHSADSGYGLWTLRYDNNTPISGQILNMNRFISFNVTSGSYANVADDIHLTVPPGRWNIRLLTGVFANNASGGNFALAIRTGTSPSWTFSVIDETQVGIWYGLSTGQGMTYQICLECNVNISASTTYALVARRTGGANLQVENTNPNRLNFNAYRLR